MAMRKSHKSCGNKTDLAEIQADLAKIQCHLAEIQFDLAEIQLCGSEHFAKKYLQLCPLCAYHRVPQLSSSMATTVKSLI